MNQHDKDYARIASAIDFIAAEVTNQPDLEAVAQHLNMSPHHCQRLFSRWVGVTPKRFLQALTVERAKQLLKASRPVLEVSDTVGLSSGSRLYDHFVLLEAVTPGEYQSSGEGLTIEWGTHVSPFGEAFVAVTRRGICQLGFIERGGADEELKRLKKNWAGAKLKRNSEAAEEVIERAFSVAVASERPLPLHVKGTNFQISVWKALLAIQPASVASYAEVAAAVRRPSSARAVGSAVGANPVAFLIPCHRVIRQSGELGGYHWGTTRKMAMHAWETAQVEGCAD